MPPNEFEAPLRCKVYVFSNVIFGQLLGAGAKTFEVLTDAVPAGAVVINARMSEDWREVLLLVQSDEFPVCPPGIEFPRVSPTVRNLSAHEPYTR